MFLFPAPTGPVRPERPAAPVARSPQRRWRPAEQQDYTGTCLEKEAGRGGEQGMERRERGGDAVSIRRGRAGELRAEEDGERGEREIEIER